MARKLEPGEYVLSGRHGVRVRAVVEGNSITIKRGSHISAATPSAFIGRHPNLKQERDRLLGLQVLQPRNEDGQPVDDPAHAANFEVMRDISAIESDDGKPLTPHTAASLALAGDISAKRWEAAETGSTPRAENSDSIAMALANSAVKHSQAVESETNSNIVRPNAGEKASAHKPASNGLAKEPLEQVIGATQLEEAASEQSQSAYQSAEMGKSRKLGQPDEDLEERIVRLQRELTFGLENYVKASREVTEDIIKYIDSKHPRPAFSITSRIKSTDSLRNKVLRKHPQRQYRNLDDFSDIAGVRLILYSTDFQGTIEDLNGRWSAGSGKVKFANKSKSYDLKGRESFDPNDAEDSWYFAYHFDLNVTIDKRGEKLEIPCEVQITNIMRHAINEIGHDLVYKPSHPDDNVKQAWKTDQGLKDIFWALQLTLHAASTAVSKIQSKAYAIERSTSRIQTNVTAEDAPGNWKAPFIGSQRATLDATETLVRRLGLEWKQADKEADADISDRVPTVLQYAVNKGNRTIRNIVEHLDGQPGLVSSLEELNMGQSLAQWSLENLLAPYNAKARMEHEARANGSNRAWLTSERSSDIVLLLLLELLAIKDPKGVSDFYTGGATGDPKRKQGAPRILDRIVKTFLASRSDRP